MAQVKKGPRILIYDIETSPMLGYIWSLWDQNVALNQLKQDWFILSWSAKWLGEKTVMNMNQSTAKNIEDDSKILKGLWKLLDEADIVITQNGKKFDEKKINARFILNGMPPVSSYKHIDTCQIAKNKFGFTSSKLEYLTAKLCKKHKKSLHKKFNGFDLWKECLSGNKAAWKEMKMYNNLDVLSLEELYLVLQPWDNSVNFQIYNPEAPDTCKCGGTYRKKGYGYTSSGKYQRYVCVECGHNTRDKVNLVSPEERKNLKVKP